MRASRLSGTRPSNTGMGMLRPLQEVGPSFTRLLHEFLLNGIGPRINDNGLITVGSL